MHSTQRERSLLPMQNLNDTIVTAYCSIEAQGIYILGPMEKNKENTLHTYLFS